MQMQHRETECRQLRETESKMFQTGLGRSRKDWWKVSRDHAAVLVKQLPKHVLHASQRDPGTNLEGNTWLEQLSSTILTGILCDMP